MAKARSRLTQLDEQASKCDAVTKQVSDPSASKADTLHMIEKSIKKDPGYLRKLEAKAGRSRWLRRGRSCWRGHCSWLGTSRRLGGGLRGVVGS